MIAMEQLLQILIWLIVVLGSIGAYAMSLSKMIMLAERAENIDYRRFIYPGLVNIIGYSFVGFLWGLELRRFFGAQGPIQNISLCWKKNPISCLLTTIEFFLIWVLIGYLVL